MAEAGLSKLKACEAVKLSRSSFYRSKNDQRLSDQPVIDRLNEIVSKHSMFSCLNKDDLSRIESISRRWISREEELRKLASDELLVCPNCRTSLSYKCGQVKRAHFAHRPVKGGRKCSLSKERRSATESRVLALIFEALESRVGIEVQVDVILEGSDTTIDLLICREGKPLHAYWILDRGKREDTIQKLVAPAASNTIPHSFIFTSEAIENTGRKLIMAAAAKRLEQYTAIYDLEEEDVDDETEYGHFYHFKEAGCSLEIYRGIHNESCGRSYDYSIHRHVEMADLVISESGEFLSVDDIAHAEKSAGWLTYKEATKHREKRLREHKGISWGDTGKSSQSSIDSTPLELRELPTNSTDSLIDRWSGELECKYCNGLFTKYSIQIPHHKCVCHECLPTHTQQQAAENWEW